MASRRGSDGDGAGGDQTRGRSRRRIGGVRRGGPRAKGGATRAAGSEKRRKFTKGLSMPALVATEPVEEPESPPSPMMSPAGPTMVSLSEGSCSLGTPTCPVSLCPSCCHNVYFAAISGSDSLVFGYAKFRADTTDPPCHSLTRWRRSERTGRFDSQRPVGA